MKADRRSPGGLVYNKTDSAPRDSWLMDVPWAGAAFRKAASGITKWWSSW
jgi:hypothetical protein